MTAGMGQSFSYDGANRLKTAGNGNSSFGYDGDGTRVKKTENGANTFYVKSSVLGQTVMEVNSTGVMRAFVYSGGKLVAMQGTDGQFYWLHTNHLGNARTMTDANGNVAYGGQFDPYGQTLAEWSGSGNTNLNTKKFTGYERDAATGLDYAQARMYNSSRGRFTSPDPIGLKAADVKRPQSLNQYSYVYNDPVNFVDQTGTFAQPVSNGYINYGIDGCLKAGGIWAVTGYNSVGVPVWGCVSSGGSVSVSVGANGLNNGNNNSNTDNRATLDGAISRAKERIKGDCAKLFDGLNVDDYLNNSVSILSTMPNGENFPSETVYAATWEDPILKKRSTHLNPNSTFFTGKEKGILYNTMLSTLTPEQRKEAALEKINSLRDLQELVVLHELYHAAEKTITDDRLDPSKGRDIDRIIQGKCF